MKPPNKTKVIEIILEAHLQPHNWCTLGCKFLWDTQCSHLNQRRLNQIFCLNWEINTILVKCVGDTPAPRLLKFKYFHMKWWIKAEPRNKTQFMFKLLFVFKEIKFLIQALSESVTLKANAVIIPIIILLYLNSSFGLLVVEIILSWVEQGTTSAGCWLLAWPN